MKNRRPAPWLQTKFISDFCQLLDVGAEGQTGLRTPLASTASDQPKELDTRLLNDDRSQAFLPFRLTLSSECAKSPCVSQQGDEPWQRLTNRCSTSSATNSARPCSTAPTPWSPSLISSAAASTSGCPAPAASPRCVPSPTARACRARLVRTCSRTTATAR